MDLGTNKDKFNDDGWVSVSEEKRYPMYDGYAFVSPSARRMMYLLNATSGLTQAEKEELGNMVPYWQDHFDKVRQGEGKTALGTYNFKAYTDADDSKGYINPYAGGYRMAPETIDEGYNRYLQDQYRGGYYVPKDVQLNAMDKLSFLDKLYAAGKEAGLY